MAKSKQQRRLAKLTCPKAGNILSRTRLYQLWDGEIKKGTRILWLSVPAGSGKTVAIADFLHQRGLPTLWYQMDEGDADPSSFIHYLGQAVDYTESRELPALTPEYVLGLKVFARNYFRELGQHLPIPSLLVFDNFQDLPESAITHELIAAGLAELPEGVTVTILSRNHPPKNYARWQAHGDLRVYDWEVFRLNSEENSAVCCFLKGDALSQDKIDKLFGYTKGWITGLVLMLESNQMPETESNQQELIFNYFANEIFNQADSAVQDLLLKTALLPEMTLESIIAVTGLPDAGDIIESLVHRNFFILKLSGYYRYHPLFLQFLLITAQKKYSPAEYVELTLRSANALHRVGKPELAMPLYLAGKDYIQASTLLLQIAPSLHEQGRDATLREWAGKLPADLAAGNGWIQYWLGQSMMVIAPLQAQSHFEQAYNLFSETQDLDGLYRAISGGCRSLYLSQEKQTGQDIWISRFVALEDIHPLTDANTDTADVLANALLAMHWRDPTNPSMLKNLQLAQDMWSETKDIDKRLNLGVTITSIFEGLGKLLSAIDIMKQQDILVSNQPRASLSILWHYMYLGFAYSFAGEQDKSQAAVETGLQMSEQSGIHVADLLLLAVGTYSRLIVGDLEKADQYLQRMQAMLVMMPMNLDTAHYHHLMGWRNLYDANTQAAVRESLKGVEIAEVIGAKYPLALCKYGLAHAYLANGDLDQAENMFESAHCPYGTATFRRLDYEIELGECCLALRRGERELALHKLEEGLQHARLYSEGPPLWSYPDFVFQIAELALQEEIEVELVQKMIRTCKLTPKEPPIHLENWPYPVRIYTLGRFSLLKDDKPVHFASKAHSKPLEMLKMLIAFGGRDISELQLSENLWPESDGDAAHSAFTTTLSRLRKLIGQDTLVIKSGNLSLNDRLCWVDVWACNRLLGQLDKIAERSKAENETAMLLQRALELHHGPFLQAETGGWAISLRENIRTRLLRYIKNQIAAQHDCPRVIELYEMALQLDDLSEDSYRGLMGCLAAQGHHAEACAIYKRCHDILHATFGIEVGSQTRELYQAIREENTSILDKTCKVCKLTKVI